MELSLRGCPLLESGKLLITFGKGVDGWVKLYKRIQISCNDELVILEFIFQHIDPFLQLDHLFFILGFIRREMN